MAGTGKTSNSKLLGALVERMKTDKKFELAVYGVLILIGVLIFVFSSCDAWGFGADTGNAADGGSYGKDDVEARLEEILSSIEGAGKVKVMIVREDDGAISGAIVTAQGAGSISVKIQLQNAVRTVLGIEINQVEIFEMESNHAEGE